VNTIAEYITELKKLDESLQPFVEISIDAGGDELEANLKNRVFNENVDVNGKGFGVYSPGYKAYRLSVGRDASRKNLQLTDKMRFGIHFDKQTKELRFRDEEDAIKGRSNELYLIKVKGNSFIFDASESEVEKTISVVEEIFNELTNGILN